MLQITSQPIGVGQERACYLHPEDAGKVIKVLTGASDKQTRRELVLYNNLARREMYDFKHIPQYYGQLKTNLGQGFVVDLIADYDGAVSRSLWWHFEQGYPLAEFMPYLDELRQYLLDNLIIFSADMGRYNVLFQKTSPQQARLVVIDGLGNHSRINWFDNIAWMARRKIRRRWHRFISRLENYSAQMMREYDASPRTLESAYRMTASLHVRAE